MIIRNQPNSAVLYSWAFVDDDFNKFRCIFWCYPLDLTIERWAVPTKIIMHVHGAGTVRGQGLFCSAWARWPVREQFKGGKNSRKYGILILLTCQLFILQCIYLLMYDILLSLQFLRCVSESANYQITFFSPVLCCTGTLFEFELGWDKGRVSTGLQVT